METKEHEDDLERDRGETEEKRVDSTDERVAELWREQNAKLDRLTSLVEESLRKSEQAELKATEALEQTSRQTLEKAAMESPHVPESEEDQESLEVVMPEQSTPRQESREERRLMRRGL